MCESQVEDKELLADLKHDKRQERLRNNVAADDDASVSSDPDAPLPAPTPIDEPLEVFLANLGLEDSIQPHIRWAPPYPPTSPHTPRDT